MITVYPDRIGQLVISEIKANLTLETRSLNTKRGFYQGEVTTESVDK